MVKRIKRFFLLLVLLAAPILAWGYFTQLFLDHSDASFTPDYPRVELTEETSAEEIFRQTGLSPAAAEAILESQGLDGLITYQDAFFAEKQVTCQDVFTYIVRQDILAEGPAPEFAGVQTGDILVSLSPHSAGWRHGHAAIVLNDYAMLQLIRYGTRSGIYYSEKFRKFSQYAVLRLKDRPEDFPATMFDYALENLVDIPYGLLGPKAPELENARLMCTSLVWYGYYQQGYDVDADGGWFVSGQDILDSPLLEVVQVYGMDPEKFIDRLAQ